MSETKEVITEINGFETTKEKHTDKSDMLVLKAHNVEIKIEGRASCSAVTMKWVGKSCIILTDILPDEFKLNSFEILLCDFDDITQLSNDIQSLDKFKKLFEEQKKELKTIYDKYRKRQEEIYGCPCL